jgi:hypothetical protein
MCIEWGGALVRPIAPCQHWLSPREVDVGLPEVSESVVCPDGVCEGP